MDLIGSPSERFKLIFNPVFLSLKNFSISKQLIKHGRVAINIHDLFFQFDEEISRNLLIFFSQHRSIL